MLFPFLVFIPLTQIPLTSSGSRNFSDKWRAVFLPRRRAVKIVLGFPFEGAFRLHRAGACD